MPLSKEDMNSLYAELLNRLVESGEWDRIKAVLEAKLNESGWKDQVKDQAKEQARQMEDLSFQALLDKIKPTAEGMVAPAVKREVVAMLRQQVDRQCE